jgi:hypothetical protein
MVDTEAPFPRSFTLTWNTDVDLGHLSPILKRDLTERNASIASQVSADHRQRLDTHESDRRDQITLLRQNAELTPLYPGRQAPVGPTPRSLPSQVILATVVMSLLFCDCDSSDLRARTPNHQWSGTTCSDDGGGLCDAPRARRTSQKLIKKHRVSEPDFQRPSLTPRAAVPYQVTPPSVAFASLSPLS